MIEIYLLIGYIVGGILGWFSYGPLKRFEKQRNEKYRREKNELLDS